MSVKNNDKDVREKDLELLGEISAPKKQGKKTEERKERLDADTLVRILGMGTSESKRAAQEAAENRRQKASSEQEAEAAKRKQNNDLKTAAIDLAVRESQKAIEKYLSNPHQDAITDITNELKSAFGKKDKDIEDAFSSLNKAKNEVNKIRGTAKKVSELLKDPRGLGQAAINVLSQKGLLKLREAILAGKLSEIATLEGITKEVMEKWDSVKDGFKTISEKLAAKKAYILSYVKATFGNPEYIKNLTEKLAEKIDTTLKNMVFDNINDYSVKLDKKIDSVFSKVDGKLNEYTSKIYAKLDSVTKLLTVENLTKKIEGVISLDKLKEKLGNSPIGKLFGGKILDHLGGMQGKIATFFKGEKFQKIFSKVTGAVQRITTALNKAKDFIAQKKQMLKDYVNQLKEKAISIIKEYASKIIGDISSKISVAIGGALSSAAGKILG